MWSVAFALIPKRYLIAAAALVALLIWAICFVRYERGVGFDKGYFQAYDSMQVVKTKRLIAQHSRDSAIADSAVRVARTQTNALVLVRDSLDDAMAKRPTGLRMEPLPDSFARVPSTDKVRVIVASTGDTVDDVPRLAAVYWFRTDSLLGIAKALLDKYAAANAAWSSAWSDEHAARIGADSLVALYAERLRSQTVPPSVSHAKRDAVYLTLGVIAGAVLHNQFHRTPNSVSTSRSVVVAAKDIR